MSKPRKHVARDLSDGDIDRIDHWIRLGETRAVKKLIALLHRHHREKETPAGKGWRQGTG